MKKIILILPLIFWGLISCQDNQAKAELEKLHAQLEVEAQNKATVKRLLDNCVSRIQQQVHNHLLHLRWIGINERKRFGQFKLNLNIFLK